MKTAAVDALLRYVGPIVTVGGLILGLAACSGPKEDRLLVFAAASLADVFNDIEVAYEASTDMALEVTYGGSQALAQQIASGAPADVFISAGAFPTQFLSDRGHVSADQTAILTNKLVVASLRTAGPPLGSMDDMKTDSFRRIAVADPDLAPAGRYAKEALVSLDLWEVLGSKLVFGQDVRSTLAYVESGNADLALVYVTDAQAGRDLRVAHMVPVESYSPIGYPAAVVRRSGDVAAATDFVAFLAGEEAAKIFSNYGFQTAR